MPDYMVECPVCHKKLNRIDATYKGSEKRYYHPECADGSFRVLTDREELENYICQLYKIDKLTGQMQLQINNYERNLGYSLKGMELTLKYFHEILGNGVKDGAGVGIIPYVYEDATQQYINKLNVKKKLKDVEQEDDIEVFIKKNRKKRKRKHIDIDSIE